MKPQIWLITLIILALIAGPVWGLTFWTGPAELPEARLAFQTLACLAEQVADGRRPVLWAAEAQPDGFGIVPDLKTHCPRSRLTAVDRKF
jgi:hypothetical protein